VMVHTVFLPNFPVYHAEYILGGDQILASSRRPFLYQIDVASESCSKMTTLSGKMKNRRVTITSLLTLHGVPIFELRWNPAELRIIHSLPHWKDIGVCG